MKKKKSSRRRKKGAPSPKSTTIFSASPFDPMEEQLADEVLFRRLVLIMALERPRPTSDNDPAKVLPLVIGEGFYWKDYPHIENVLYDHMEEYYEWSIKERQSKCQQSFNNKLMDEVRYVARKNGNEFDALVFDDKRLRDRIRCFYKTHIQNAKKRLNTMKKNLDRNGPLIQTLLDKAHNPSQSNSPCLVPTVSLEDENEPSFMCDM